MAGYRERFIYNLKYVTPFLSQRLLSLVTRQKLILPVYHLVSDHEVLHIKHLYRYKNVRDFKKDLSFILRHFSPIDLPTLISIDAGQPLKQPSFLLSFDDGLSEFGGVIAPILEQMSIPAVCFLNNDFIDNKALFFRYKISLLIEALKQDPSQSKKQQVQHLLAGKCHDGNPINALLKLHHSDLALIDEIAEKLQVNFEQYLTSEKPYLTTLQIQSLIDRGFHFGAHSVSHPAYFRIELEQQLRETIDSIEGLAEKFPDQPKSFAFPFTDHQVTSRFFSRLRANVPDLTLTFGSAGQKRDLAAGHYQRIPMEMNNLPASQIIKSEMLYYAVKGMFQKNTIVR